MSNNLTSLHGEEERLRAETLAHIERKEELKDHLYVTGEAMNIIWGLTHDHPHKDDDELTVQFLGIRLFNSAAASIKLAFSGYYQNAFQHLRDILETYFLLDYLRSNPDKLAIWKGADRKQLMKEYGPAAIRAALDRRDGLKEQKRKAIYDLISAHATHATYKGFWLTTKNQLGEIGPFFSEDNLLAWMQEAAKMLTHAAVIYGTYFEGLSLELLRLKEQYLEDLGAWRRKHLEPKPPTPEG
jgi:hypothetical protein